MTIPNTKWLASGPQVILKSDFIELEDAILTQGTVRMQPPLVYVDAHTVRVEATADCEASMQFTGLPNVLNPSVQVNGGLCDGKIRTVVANLDMDFAASGLYGTTQTEKASQWYAVFAVAADLDTDYELKALPFCRVKSQAGQVLSLGTMTTPATGIGYGFTTDDLVSGMVFFISGASKGLMRTISANNNDDATGGTITYSGAALTVAAGDWFYLLPATNFRLLGAIFNDSGSDIVSFSQIGNRVDWLEPFTLASPNSPAVEDIKCGPPTAIAIGVSGLYTTSIGHPDGTNYIPLGSILDEVVPTYGKTFGEAPVKYCKYAGGYYNTMDAHYFKYPPGCGY